MILIFYASNGKPIRTPVPPDFEALCRTSLRTINAVTRDAAHHERLTAYRLDN